MPNPLIGQGWKFPIGPDAGGGVGLSADATEIEEAIRIIIGTSLGERVMRPDFGCRIHELVFHPTTPDTLTAARNYVAEALAWWEPRIEVTDIHADWDRYENARMNVHVYYEILATKDPRALVYPFYLIEQGESEAT